MKSWHDKQDLITFFMDTFKSDPNLKVLFKDQEQNPIPIVRKPVYPPRPFEMDDYN